MSRANRLRWKLPQLDRGSAATIALVAMMFLCALLWVREQQSPGKPSPRVAAVTSLPG